MYLCVDALALCEYGCEMKKVSNVNSNWPSSAYIYWVFTITIRHKCTESEFTMGTVVIKRTFNRKWYDVDEAAFACNVLHIDKWSCWSFEKWYVRHLVGRRVNKCIKWTQPANWRTNQWIGNENRTRNLWIEQIYNCLCEYAWWCVQYTEHERKLSIDDNATVF